MQSDSGIGVVSIPVSEILVVAVVLLAIIFAIWIVRRMRRKKNSN
jgi:flagellar biogenesis protein FliO